MVNKRFAIWAGAVGIVIVILCCSLSPANLGGLVKTYTSDWMVQARTIDIALFQYANDHDGKYLEGSSSTEVFQKLLDGKYVSDPALFFTHLSGKLRALPGERLKPENVCFDLTDDIDFNDSDFLPVVFMTGYKINYVPGGNAVSVTTPLPAYTVEPRTWNQWWHGESWPIVKPVSGMVVAYKNNSVTFLPLSRSVDSNGLIPHVISPSFVPKTDHLSYRQLTPTGMLP